MAHLPPETLKPIADLLPRLFEVIDLATATEYNLFERYGETVETISELTELKNVTERVRIFYNRLYSITLQVAQSQPIASFATLNLLESTIEQAQAVADAGDASVIEIKRTWGL
jgi:hypothetical protein